MSFELNQIDCLLLKNVKHCVNDLISKLIEIRRCANGLYGSVLTAVPSVFSRKTIKGFGSFLQVIDAFETDGTSATAFKGLLSPICARALFWQFSSSVFQNSNDLPSLLAVLEEPPSPASPILQILQFPLNCCGKLDVSCLITTPFLPARWQSSVTYFGVSFQEATRII